MPTIEQIQRLLTSEPDDSFLLYALAQELANTDHHAEAVAQYDLCLAGDPLSCYAYFHKARSLSALGQDDQAADTIRKGLEAAKQVGDAKALDELTHLLDDLS